MRKDPSTRGRYRELFSASLVAMVLAGSQAAGSPDVLGQEPSPAEGAGTATERAEAQLQRLEERGPLANPYRAGRAMTMSRRGLVASSHVLASQAGIDMLRSGGTAIDAAVAAAATLTVVEPMMTSAGGDVFILYYEAATGEVHALNGSGRSPRALRRQYFEDEGLERVPSRGWESVTVPGALDAWATAQKRFGSKSFAEVLEPAIHYAEEGYAVTETVAGMWSAMASGLEADEWARRTFLIDGGAPGEAEVFRNPNLARTYRLLAKEGRDAFYRGAIAEEIVRWAQESGGFLTMADFEAHRSEWVDPVHVSYRGYEVYQCPPNSQGIAALAMLNILEGFDLASMKHNSAEYLHLLIEAKKLAYADTYAYVADPDHIRVPIEEMLSKVSFITSLPFSSLTRQGTRCYDADGCRAVRTARS